VSSTRTDKIRIRNTSQEHRIGPLSPAVAPRLAACRPLPADADTRARFAANNYHRGPGRCAVWCAALPIREAVTAARAAGADPAGTEAGSPRPRLAAVNSSPSGAPAETTAGPISVVGAGGGSDALGSIAADRAPAR
jgi:hypothetical protein